MEKGWGLTLDNSKQVGFFVNKPIFGFNLSPRMNHSKGSMFAGVDFPASVGRMEEAATSSAAAADNGKRVFAGEVDFFSDQKRHSDIVKKENIADTPRTDLDVNTGLQLVTANTGSDQSTVDDSVSSDVEDKRAKNELAKLQIQLEHMHAENQRLRGMLKQVTTNYSALQMHIESLMQQQRNSRTDSPHEQQVVVDRRFQENHENGGAILPRKFLELGPSANIDIDEPATRSSSEEITLSGSPRQNVELSRSKMIAREASPESESWAPSKVPKLNPVKSGVDEATEATMRKARVSVRARSEAPMISDGCQWRKYGQKMAKGNPCPRAYYRCTMAVGCPVRKQVQRCAEDRTILITTYEGTHNHPLPPAAMAMASTTSAAVNMLLSGSMPSADGLMNPNFLARAILPCSSSMATISASAPFPTVTLDLTQSPNPLQFQRPPAATQFQIPFASMSGSPMPQVFGQALHNQSKFTGLQMSQDAQVLHQSQNVQMHHAPATGNQVSFAETLSAATAAITADPNFTAALAAAISSIIGGPHANNSGNISSNTTATATTISNINISTSNNKTNS